MYNYFLLYKTINKITNRFYIGVHATNFLEDGYLGSGKRLKYEINKYGKENFERIILKFCSSKEEMLFAEKEFVTQELLNDELNLNLKLGGEGGWDYLNAPSKCSYDRRSLAGKKCHTKHPNLAEENLKKGRTSQASKKSVKTIKEKYGENWFSEMVSSIPRTKEWNKKISNTLKGRTGVLSPNFGIQREKVKCPHCGKEGAKGNMKIWHFEKCKMGPKH